MSFALIQDFADAITAMLSEGMRRRIPGRLEESIGRDARFID
jgi:hypothetical protein